MTLTQVGIISHLLTAKNVVDFVNLAVRVSVGNPVGLNRSPLVAALLKLHFGIADLLYQRNADAGIRVGRSQTLLRATSAGGRINIVQWLIDSEEKECSRKHDGKTPPHLEQRMDYQGRTYLSTPRTKMTGSATTDRAHRFSPPCVRI